MKDDPEADQFEVVKYPAIAGPTSGWTWATQEPIRGAPEPALVNDEDPIRSPRCPVRRRSARRMRRRARACTLKLLRPKGGALHPERYNLRRLR